ncbi:cyclin domain-containing protein [Hirsutella rhossiliensis]|uniref:Cyclin domain-containing protein n=1 Tax=Hirsutella rhossiliensis TaxID=111463 RepID=A0A9P8SIX4_9HYPO|nr:cyclin domain-containing protein [Hirsutella rhossiliensis]KAH0964336.1 cyclin domain-containing protein [Hirsutella rhossiliensis]
MKCDAHHPLAFVATSARYAPSNSSFSSSASVSAWSDATSHSPDDASSANTSDSDSCDGRAPIDNAAALRRPLPQREVEPVAPELRLNPRRNAAGYHGRLAAPPVLVRQSDRRINFVDNLVDSSTQIVEAVWPLSSVVCRNEPGSKTVLPLRTFIQETLRRSRTSYSTLQVALYYLILIKPHVPKHNFTTEQPDDRVADRALQCGRRMFLSALILASKYLQDRNYSARAWSKISGLNTHEINQNEMAFLLAVNWKLHIADDVFHRWTDIVLKCTPPPFPPSPGGTSQFLAHQTADWKHIILRLDPELTNVECLIAAPQPSPGRPSDLSVLSPRSILNLPQEPPLAAPAPKPVNVPAFMEPTPTSAFTTGRSAPTLGLLPTPRLTPQTNGICTPAVSAASQILGKGGAMGMAMAHASCISTVQSLDRFPCSVTSSPQVYCPVRRSSLANSVSTASSPESMVSDSSRSSRSSSTSSVSSLASATHYNSSGRCSVPSRFRVARLWNDRACAKPTVPSVPEDHDEWCLSASPETYNGPVAKLGDLSLDTPLARRERELDDVARDAVSDAARVLQDLHNHGCSANSTPTARTGRKRSRAASTSDNPLQDNVRDILSGRRGSSASAWPDVLVRPGDVRAEAGMQFPVRPTLGGTGKRVCCSAEAASVYPALSLRGPGMWDGILN